jgi:hypothetical protein
MRTSATASRALLIAALSAGITSCTKSPPPDEASPVERHIRGPSGVRIFTMLPECEYVVTGSVEARRCSSRWVSRHLRELAWRAGGEAIIYVVTYETQKEGCYRDAAFVMLGAAIRFTDPECMH